MKVPYLYPILLLCFSTFTHALTKPEDNPLDRFLKTVKTLDVVFEQQVLDLNGNIRSLANGKLYLSRPNKLRWEYKNPEKQTIIADGLYIWIYNEDLEQASSSFQNLAVRGTPAEILLNTKQLYKKYKIRKTGETTLVLIPKKEGKYRWISLQFTENGILSQLEMENKLEQRIRFNFYNEKRNITLDKKLFIFEAGDNVDIFEH